MGRPGGALERAGRGLGLGESGRGRRLLVQLEGHVLATKAALESVTRYLARDLGPEGVRVNLVAAGPIETLAASGIEGFDGLARTWEQAAPLGWDTTDPEPVADAACMLLSDWSRCVSGHVLHADGGAHAVKGMEAAAVAAVPVPA